MQRNRLRIRHLLMTTASATAMIVGLNSGAEAAGCIPVVAPASNSGPSPCVVLSGTGNVANNIGGTISNTTTAGLASTTHAVAVTGVLSGQIQNNGTIISRYPVGPILGPNPTDIKLINITGVVTGGISNNGLIEAFGVKNATGIYIGGTASFGGGITNTSIGLIQAVGNGATNFARGIYVDGVSIFTGGINNSGRITATGGPGSGTSTTRATGLRLNSISTFSGGIVNSGTIS